ncbi:MAG: TIR domain-containing protein [Desulfobacterales bacterium]
MQPMQKAALLISNVSSMEVNENIMNRKPRIFIGSSVESLSIADAVNLNLDHQAEVTIWRNGTFDLSSNTIDSLEKKAKSVDFSLFIFSPDDIVIIRNQEKVAVRDNIVFELGLFIGALGKERCFILKPRGVDLHLPTDLLSVTPADYEPNRSDGDLASAVNHACVLIKNQMEKLQPLRHVQKPPQPLKNTVDVISELNATDFSVLKELVSTFTASPNGYSIYVIKNNLKNQSYEVDLSAIKLEKLGYIEKRNESDYDGNEYYAYKITNEGVEILLQREKEIPF